MEVICLLVFSLFASKDICQLFLNYLLFSPKRKDDKRTNGLIFTCIHPNRTIITKDKGDFVRPPIQFLGGLAGWVGKGLHGPATLKCTSGDQPFSFSK